MFTEEPDVRPFDYCLVPADGASDVQQLRFTGNSEQGLREELQRYFAKQGITSGQEVAFKDHMMGEVKKNEAKHTVQPPADKSPAVAAAAPPPEAQAEALLDLAMKQGSGSYEIVPVLYPEPANGYTGTSLYIDQVGRFKELPLNERASKMAQRDIRGDAFVLRNHDDPIKDKWARVDCQKEDVDGLIAVPPSAAEDPQRRAMRMQSAGQYTKVTPEMFAKAQSLREEGNNLYKKGELTDAEARYSSAIEQLNGRRDEVDQEEAKALELKCLLNRAQARLKGGKHSPAEGDCTTVLALDPRCVKALFRRAQARRALKDFDAALEDIAAATPLASAEEAPEITKLGETLQRERKQHQAKEREKFASMFGK